MPRVSRDDQLASALRRFVKAGHGGNKAKASADLELTRPMLYRGLKGDVLPETANRIRKSLDAKGYEVAQEQPRDQAADDGRVSEIALQVLRFMTQAVERAGPARGDDR